MIWIKDEIVKIIPAVIYFALAFNLIYYTTGLVIKPGEVRHFTPLTVTLSALIVGKILLIVNALPIINMFPRKPLIYNIFWKSILYSFFTFLLWTLESFIHLTRKYKSLVIVFEHYKLELHSPIVWATLIWLSSLFLIFVTVNEFVHVIGKGRVIAILFVKGGNKALL